MCRCLSFCGVRVYFKEESYCVMHKIYGRQILTKYIGQWVTAHLHNAIIKTNHTALTLTVLGDFFHTTHFPVAVSAL